MELISLIAAAALAVPHPPEVLRLAPQLARVQKFSRTVGAKLWPGYEKAPFGFLLVGSKEEYLICQVPRPDGFTSIGKNSVTGCDVFRRPRSGLPDGLLAALPILGFPATIVMGTPETTGLGEASWSRTILDEHFHQWQYGLPNYWSRVDALDLKGGDESGKWMLEFPFPYEEASPAHATASRALAKAIEARGKPDFSARFRDYLAARRAFADAVGERNWRYFEFQLWQEGVARWLPRVRK